MLLADMSRQIKIQAEASGNQREEIERTGELNLTSADVNFARYLYEQTKDPSVAYQYLVEEGGDAYAKLAMGVAKGNSLAGQAAVIYLHNVADEHNKPLSDAQTNNMYGDMLLGHLDILESRLKKSDLGVIYGDINHKEASKFHERVFKKYGLPPSAWTLEPVFKFMPEYKREGYWQNTLRSAGNPFDELLLSINTLDFMLDQLKDAPALAQPEIHQWLWAVSDIDNIGVVGGVIGDELIEKLIEIRDWVTDLPLSTCYPNSMLCEMNWRPNVSESFVENFVFDNRELFNIGEFSYNAPMPSRYLTDYHMDRPSYGLPESGLFGGSSYNSPFNSSFSPSSGIDRLANMMSSNRSLGEFGFGDFYSPSRSFDFGSNLSFGGFGHRW